jgi:hypothetical protein
MSFLPEPAEDFFDQPASVLANIRELLFSHSTTCTFKVINSVFPYLDRFENLEVLTLSTEEYGEYLAAVLPPPDYVHNALHTLNVVNITNPFKKFRIWRWIPRLFPKLLNLNVQTDAAELHLMYDVYDISCYGIKAAFLTKLFAKKFKHLENITLRNLNVPLDELLEMVLRMVQKTPVKIRSVLCQSWHETEVVPSGVELEKIQKLREVPDCQVKFRVMNGEGLTFVRWDHQHRRDFAGGFYFAFLR